jgi:hypothetical protein
MCCDPERRSTSDRRKKRRAKAGPHACQAGKPVKRLAECNLTELYTQNRTHLFEIFTLYSKNLSNSWRLESADELDIAVSGRPKSKAAGVDRPARRQAMPKGTADSPALSLLRRPDWQVAGGSPLECCGGIGA